MSDRHKFLGMERLIAWHFDCGTWFASAVISFGMIVAFSVKAASTGTNIVAGGIAIIIALPVLRVTLMLITFCRERDYLFATICCVVLTTIGAGIFIGLRGTHLH